MPPRRSGRRASTTVSIAIAIAMSVASTIAPLDSAHARAMVATRAIAVGGAAPEEAAPEEGAPGDGAPADGAPRNDAPGNGAPGGGAPGGDAPAEGAPGGDAPEEGAPGDGAPADGAPGEGAPTDGAPTDGAPGDAADATPREAPPAEDPEAPAAEGDAPPETGDPAEAEPDPAADQVAAQGPEGAWRALVGRRVTVTAAGGTFTGELMLVDTSRVRLFAREPGRRGRKGIGGVIELKRADVTAIEVAGTTASSHAQAVYDSPELTAKLKRADTLVSAGTISLISGAGLFFTSGALLTFAVLPEGPTSDGWFYQFYVLGGLGGAAAITGAGLLAAGAIQRKRITTGRVEARVLPWRTRTAGGLALGGRF